MFFSEPLLESIFGAQSADLCSKSRFLEPFRISTGPENDLRGDHFEPKGLQMASPFYRGLRLQLTLRSMTPQNAPRTPFLQFGIDFRSILAPFL